MGRAQLRGASRSRRFYFRKDVLPPGYTSPAASTASSSGDSSPVENGCCKGRGKEAKMRNCFPSLPRPLNGVRRGPVEDEYEEMTMEEIICGKVRKKKTLSYMLIFYYYSRPIRSRGYWDLLMTTFILYKSTRKIGSKLIDISTSSEEEQTVRCFSFLFLFLLPAYVVKGSLQTPATWIRNFVRTHPAYKFDSVVSEEINYDLMKAIDDM